MTRDRGFAGEAPAFLGCRSRCVARVRIAAERLSAGRAAARARVSRATTAAIPHFRTEWWYITGWLADGAGNDYGVQITFFRNRPRVAEANPSAFAPRQLLFAHAALAIRALGRLRARPARGARGLRSRRAPTRHDARRASTTGRSRSTATRYAARIAARDFALDLAFAPRSRCCCRARRASRARARGPGRRATTTAGRSSRRRGRSASTASTRR